MINPESLRRYRLLWPRRDRPLSERASRQRMLDAEPPANIGKAIGLARTDDDPRVHHGGTLAAIHHGAGIERPDQRDIYISAADADSFRAVYCANPNADDPNVILRIVDGPIASTDKFVPPIVAALDLLDAADTRAATEALRVLR